MSGDNRQEAFEALSSGLDDFVREAVGEDLARQGRDIHAGRFALEDVAERLKVGVTPADDGVTQLERRDIGLPSESYDETWRCGGREHAGCLTNLAHNLIIGVHLAAKPCGTLNTQTNDLQRITHHASGDSEPRSRESSLVHCTFPRSVHHSKSCACLWLVTRVMESSAYGLLAPACAGLFKDAAACKRRDGGHCAWFVCFVEGEMTDRSKVNFGGCSIALR